MAVRIQLRRDTAANWTSNNPVLRQGEIGIETDTYQMKVGDGTSTWTQITQYMNVVPDGNLTIQDYVPVSDIGAENGVVGLSSNNAIIPGSSIILEGATANAFETTLTATDPTADRTITFKDASGTVAFTSDIPSNTDGLSEGTTNLYFTDDRAQDAVATALSNGTHTNISVSYNDGSNAISLTGAVTYTDENAQDAVGNAVGTGLSYNDSTGAISVDTATIQARVADVSDTEIGYLNGVTSAIQTQIDSKLSTSTASSTYQPIVSGVSDTEIGYLNGVTSAIQTQLDNKLALSGGTLTGALTLHADPGSALHAATKQYVDNTASGIVAKPQVLGATTANIDATYDNGTLGVGATLTHNTNGAFPTSAGGAEGWAVGKGILVKNQTNKAHNGRYYVSDMGSPSTPYVLTRCTYCDEASEIPGAYIFVQDGTNAGTGWVQTVADATTFTVGTDDINIVQFSGSGTITAGTGITVNGNEVSINTAATVDLSTAQTLTNKTLTSPKINEDVAVTATATEINTLDGITASTAELNILDGVTATSAEINVLDGITSSVSELNILTGVTATSSELNALDGITASTAELNTLDGITASTAELNILDGVTADYTELNILDGATLSTTELNYVDGVTSAIQTQLDSKIDESLFDTKGDILVASADNTPAKLAVGTNGYLLTANSSATNGVEWAAAPVSLPSQSGENGKYLTTDGTTASWATLVVPIETGTATVTANTASTVDTTALSAFTSIEYMVSLKQGSKIRTSKVVVQTDGTSVDMTEFAITETGGTIAGVVVSAAVSSTDAVLQVTATDATSTNVTVKFSKVKL